MSYEEWVMEMARRQALHGVLLALGIVGLLLLWLIFGPGGGRG